MNQRAIVRSVACIAALFIVACGGSAKGPSSLQYTFQDGYLAPVPPENQQHVLDAHRDVHGARAELDHARFLLADIASQLDLADNEARRAALLSKSADIAKKRAARSHKTPRIEAAEKMEEQAGHEENLNAAHQEYLAAERRYLEAFVEFAEHNVAAMEARLELAKAELAAAEKIAVKGFDVVNYRSQLEKRMARVNQLRTVAQGHRGTADTALQAVKTLGRAPVVKPPVQVDAPRALPAVVESLPLPAPRKKSGISAEPLAPAEQTAPGSGDPGTDAATESPHAADRPGGTDGPDDSSDDGSATDPAEDLDDTSSDGTPSSDRKPGDGDSTGR